MKHEKRFRDAEESYFDYEERRRAKRSKGSRRTSGEGELWADAGFADELPEAPAQGYRQERQAPRPAPAQTSPNQPPFQMSEEATVEIKGFKIDLSRVASISKVDTEYDGKPSHGIAFVFLGKRGLGRTFWYGRNSRQRDEEYERYAAIVAKYPH